MSRELEERIDAYLEGALSLEESDRLERELVDPNVASLFSEALMLRDLLKSTPPERPPDFLIERIQASLELEKDSKDPIPRLGRTRAALSGFGWVLRGPAMAFASSQARSGSREALAGLGTLRYGLGPFNRQKSPKEKKAPRRSLLRRLLSRNRK